MLRKYKGNTKEMLREYHIPNPYQILIKSLPNPCKILTKSLPNPYQILAKSLRTTTARLSPRAEATEGPTTGCGSATGATRNPAARRRRVARAWRMATATAMRWKWSSRPALPLPRTDDPPGFFLMRRQRQRTAAPGHRRVCISLPEAL